MATDSHLPLLLDASSRFSPCVLHCQHCVRTSVCRLPVLSGSLPQDVCVCGALLFGSYRPKEVLAVREGGDRPSVHHRACTKELHWPSHRKSNGLTWEPFVMPCSKASVFKTFERSVERTSAGNVSCGPAALRARLRIIAASRFLNGNACRAEVSKVLLAFLPLLLAGCAGPRLRHRAARDGLDQGHVRDAEAGGAQLCRMRHREAVGGGTVPCGLHSSCRRWSTVDGMTTCTYSGGCS